jgi:hypothetical protein
MLGVKKRLRSRGVRVEVMQDERCIRMMRDFIAQQPGCGTRISVCSDGDERRAASTGVLTAKVSGCLRDK